MNGTPGTMTLLATVAVLKSTPPPALLLAQKMGLILCRAGGLCAMAPLAPEIIPLRVRATLALLLCVVLVPTSPPAQDGLYPLQLISEAAVGLLAASLCRLPLAAVEAGLQIVSVSAGLGIASLLDPSSDEEVHALTELIFYAGLLIFFAMGGHHQLILALHESVQRVPPGAASVNTDTALLVLRMGQALFTTVVQVAAPVMLVTLALNLALALVSRAAPAVNIFSVSLVAVLLTGLLVVIRGLPLFAAALRTAVTHSVDALLLGLSR